MTSRKWGQPLFYMKLIRKKEGLSKVICNVTLEGDEKFWPDYAIVEELIKLNAIEWEGINQSVSRFEDSAVVTIYTD